MARWVGGTPNQEAAEPEWHGVRMDRLALKRGQKAKLVVVLREAGPGGDDDITKIVHHVGKLKDAGLIKDERLARRLTLPRVSTTLVILLSLVLVLSQLSRPPGRSIACASGELRVEGSSVLMSTMRAIADEYAKVCGDDVRITTQANGSLSGVRGALESDPARPDGLIALSDGKSNYHDRLHGEKLAIVVYYVVVNSGVGLTALTLDDLRKINKGTWTDWKQIRPEGPSLPIRFVGRGQASGTRHLFEERVLGTGENVLSSDECLEKERNRRAPVIRCERDNNAEVLDKISTIPGAIGYADAASVADARRAGSITALTLDGKAFDASTAVEAGYPFWTVEYLYTGSRPPAGSLTASFLQFVRTHSLARVRLTEAGFRPCAGTEGPVELCALR
ncbi:PstS family phosphate ABC transporter substrate-binding protein [Nonomuraea sp. NPDC002799]